ncbi:hypothetical protein BV898_18288 [Hypsibius exemplaris]|uniref:Uncharacterized protein n=1 Tax=Hypsibius exemplaris TaxID=2072580 RepID=A0A9X6RMX1_HYPEX|nr:hypothetical protein BV898_18288 [Hypsibius exemplaris]
MNAVEMEILFRESVWSFSVPFSAPFLFLLCPAKSDVWEEMEAINIEVAEAEEVEGDGMFNHLPTAQEPDDEDGKRVEIVFGTTGEETNSSSSSSDADPVAGEPSANRTIPEQREAVIRMHQENASRRQISKTVGVSAKTVIRILESSGVVSTPSKRGRRAVLGMKEEEALVNFLLELDKVNLNWTWPLFHKLLEIVAQKRDITPNAKSNKLFSSKWLVGFSTRHKKQIALRVVDYGLSGPLQNRQKAHPGRMESFEQTVRDLFNAIGIPASQENVLEVQEMWSQHVESPKTRKVFAKKGRKNVRLTIGLPSMETGQKKRVRAKRPPGQPSHHGQTVVILGPAQGVPYQPPLPQQPVPVNDAALRLALNAFMIAGYTEDDGKKILRDLNVAVL